MFKPSGRMLKLERFKTPLRKMLTHSIWIERIQKRNLRSWRFVRGVRESMRKHGERIRGVAWDYARKIGDRIAETTNNYF